MNTINDNLSFRAKLVTNLKGRNNVMDSIVKDFEKISKKVPGELKIYRDSDDPKVIFAYANNHSLCINDIKKYLSLNAPTKKQINEAAKKALATMKLISAESTYHKGEEKIANLKKELIRWENRRKKAQSRGNFIAVNTFDEIIEKLNKAIQDTEKQNTLKLSKELDKLKNKTFAQYWIDFLGTFII